MRHVPKGRRAERRVVRKKILERPVGKEIPLDFYTKVNKLIEDHIEVGRRFGEVPLLHHDTVERIARETGVPEELRPEAMVQALHMFFKKVNRVQGKEKIPLTLAADWKNLMRWTATVQTKALQKIHRIPPEEIKRHERRLRIGELAKQALKDVKGGVPLPYIPPIKIRELVEGANIKKESDLAEKLLMRYIYGKLARQGAAMSGKTLNRHVEMLRQWTSEVIEPHALKIMESLDALGKGTGKKRKKRSR